VNDNPDAYPLNWPPGRPRAHCRERSRFETTMGAAVQDVRYEVRMLGGRELVISTNIELRLDGYPRASRPAPHDKGVAVYFKLKSKPMSFACDRWDRIEDNMRAIAKTIEALRGIERWGSGSMVEQAFTGFTALPAPEQPWQVLGVSSQASTEEIERAYRRLAADHHPDRGGDSHTMARINAARDQLLGSST
jgi:hypothetical protein